MAFAGWRPDAGGVRDVVLVCDPGDNAAAEIGHAWAGKPSDLPVHFGRQRPSLFLQPNGGFTITGAVVVVPKDGREMPPRMEETRADAMPDLSQDFSTHWPGLCGPTSAADVLFAIADRDADVLPGFTRGPGEKADAGVTRLIAGGMERIAADSLAGRMGVGPDGQGATNEGMRRGLEAWLGEFAANGWEARLDWFEDAADERPRAEQREFFGRLAAAVEAGGGAVLCLWPGTEFADAPVTPPDKQAAEAGGGAAAQRGGQTPPLPEAAFPELPPAAEEPAGLPGRPASIDPQAAAATAAEKIDSARQLLDRGRAQQAYDQATEAVALLHQAAKRDPAFAPRLAEALSLCRECDGRLPRRGGAVVDKPTEFK